MPIYTLYSPSFPLVFFVLIKWERGLCRVSCLQKDTCPQLQKIGLAGNNAQGEGGRLLFPPHSRAPNYLSQWYFREFKRVIVPKYRPRLGISSKLPWSLFLPCFSGKSAEFPQGVDCILSNSVFFPSHPHPFSRCEPISCLLIGFSR